VALDTYFRGNSQELAFCQKIRAGGNHLVVATAGGRVLGSGNNLKLRKEELAPVLEEYRKLPESERKPQLPDPSQAVPAQRATPRPPAGGLIIRGYCTYMKKQKDGRLDRATEFYYKENPDRWAAETQSDMLWLTQSEWQSLVPADPTPGSRTDVAHPIQKRFFCTIGIEYMQGSVNSLPARDMNMTLTVGKVTPDAVELRLDGYATLGKEFDANLRGQPNTRGCEVRVIGYLTYDRQKKALTRLDVVGVGAAWGMKRTDRLEVRLGDYPWTYGIAWELVEGDSPVDLIPPYNLLHYNSTGPYFSRE
jgi:hypothetical protein